MASESPHVVRWGIMATGWIASTFVKDLLTDPASRDVHDVHHQVVAVASSNSAQKARDFIASTKCDESTKAYGSYAELVADADVDIVYVATPHSHHFQNAMLALEANKHVLCEKAFTVNAAQVRKLIDAAKARNLFLMEAVWTRYFPLSIKIRELIQSGAIGTVYRTVADLSFNEDDGKGGLTFADTNRMVNPDLAGGALLDLGIYSLTWVFQTLFHCQKESSKEAPQVLAAINKHSTGADADTSIICHFPGHKTVGIATTSLHVATNPGSEGAAGPAIRIQGSGGEIQVAAPAFRPLQYKVISKAGEVEVVDCPIPKDPARDWGHGMFWEADECARCLRDGKKESATMPWDESIAIMQVMESALKQGGVEYPDLITTAVYDANSPLNTGSQ
jgi:predicted dehydrogenase